MITETVDLYEYFGMERGNASGGKLTVYARTESREIKPRIRPAMLALPGGAYGMHSDREGEPIALKYVDNGFVSFVLYYSTLTAYPTPLNEAMLAVMYIRENAEKFRVDKNKVCVMGFSAGGHLAGLLSTVKDDEANAIKRRAADVRPNAAVLSYPVVTMGEFAESGTRGVITGGNKELYEKISVEKRVDENTPPSFVWHTFEDTVVPVENALLLGAAYRKNGVPFELHIYEHGWHGMALCDIETNDFGSDNKYLEYVGSWVDSSLDWLKTHGIAVV